MNKNRFVLMVLVLSLLGSCDLFKAAPVSDVRIVNNSSVNSQYWGSALAIVKAVRQIISRRGREHTKSRAAAMIAFMA
jgi:hypothetical protein